MNALASSLVGVSIATAVAAQDVFWVATGRPDRNLSGFRMTGVGDINQDGYEDVLTIVDAECGTGLAKGFLWFVSGRDGTFLREVPSQCFYCAFASVAAAGDMNSDDVPDYVASHGGSPGVITEVRSGTNDVVLWSVPGAWDQLLSDLDLDGDGLKDLIVGDWHRNGYLGEVRAYSHGGTLLYQLLGDVSATANPPLTIANAFAKLGDVDDDGCDDYVMGCWEPMARGAGVVVSGRTGAYLRVCYGELPGDGIGINVSECGDLDADGYQDFVTGNGGGFFTSRGVARAFSSRTGQVLHQWVMTPSLYFTASLASRGVDLDGDGLGDVIAGQPYVWFPSGVQGAIHAYSGRDGSQLHNVTRQPAQAGTVGWIGDRATLLRPPQGEHTGFMVVPNPNALNGPGSTCGHNYGAIVAYRGIPRTAALLGPACAGNLTTTPNLGMSSLGAAGIRVHLSNAPPNAFSVLLFGLSTTQFHGVPLPLVLDPFGLPGCALRTSVELMCTVATGSTGNNAGYASIDINRPIPTVGNGTWSVSAQWFVLGDASTFPGGMTQAIRWRM